MSRGGSQPRPDWKLTPCGTPSAARRHHRRGEPLDEACREADNNAKAQRRGRAHGNTQVPDRREVRNGLPEFVPYRYNGSGADAFTGEADE
jgi:hypothetical protein